MERDDLKVLVVDDVGFVRRTFQQMLKQNNIAVEVAESGKEAIQLLESNNTINVVITDLYMPFMNGIELFNTISKIERVNDVGRIPPPAFILSTESGNDTDIRNDKADLIQHAIDLGFVDVIRKPVSEEQLLYLLDTIANNATPDLCPLSTSHSVSYPNDSIETSLQNLRKMVGELIGLADVSSLLLMHDSLMADLSRIDAALSMYEVEPATTMAG
ncbi:MAG: hypothetical protein Tsb009_26440 [Planctomycetaceae bacterium]